MCALAKSPSIVCRQGRPQSATSVPTRAGVKKAPPPRLGGGSRGSRCCPDDHSVALRADSIVGVTRFDRITSDPAICHGQLTVRGQRYPVQMLLELLSAGMTIDEVLADYPDLERDDLLAALEFGAVVAGGQRIVPLGVA